MTESPRRATIRDVAAHAGVSPGTVSKALNGTGSVSAETRTRILAAAAETGFRPNELARSVFERRSYTVGMITTDSFERFSVPVMLGAEGPKNVALAAEICDGWLPIFYSPRIANMYNEWLDEGFARPGARRTRETFEICATAQVVVTDDRPAMLDLMKPHLALYMGGMGAEDTNFHADVYRRMGYAEVVDDVTKLFRSDRKDEAATIIPDELVDDSAIVGDLAYVQQQIKAWEAAGVTMMVVGARSPEQIRDLAGLI